MRRVGSVPYHRKTLGPLHKARRSHAVARNASLAASTAPPEFTRNVSASSGAASSSRRARPFGAQVGFKLSSASEEVIEEEPVVLQEDEPLPVEAPVVVPLLSMSERDIETAARLLRAATFDDTGEIALRAIFQTLSLPAVLRIIDVANESKDRYQDCDSESDNETECSNLSFMTSSVTEKKTGDSTTSLSRRNQRLLDNIRELFEKKGVRDGKSNNFSLSRESMLSIFQELQMPLLRFEVERIFDRIDVDSDGNLTWKEFTEAAMNDDFLEMLVEEAQQMKDWQVPNHYDFSHPTHVAYRHADFSPAAPYEPYDREKHGELFGDFKDIRAKVDYSWHVNYTQERQAWQDSVVRRTSICGQPQQSPWCIFTCGAMGTGKGYTMGWLSQRGYLELEHVVRIDPDHFKTMMPEWQGYVAKDAHKAGTMCHLESGFLQELTQEVAMEENQNIWIDGSLHDHQWYTQVFAKIRARYPYYRLAIIYIYAAPEKVFERAEKRGMQTGRFVPKDRLAHSIQKTQEAAEILGPQVDFYAVISNDCGEPLLMKCEDRGHSFRAFSHRFRLYEHITRAFPANMPPIAIADVPDGKEYFRLPWKTRESLISVNSGSAFTGTCVAMPIQDCCTPAFLNMIGPMLRGPKGATHIIALPVAPNHCVKPVMRWEGAPENAVNMLYCIGAFRADGARVDQKDVLACQKPARDLLSAQSIGFSLYLDEAMQVMGVSRKGIYTSRDTLGSRVSANREGNTKQTIFFAYSAARDMEQHFYKKFEAFGRWNVGLFPVMRSHAKQCAIVCPQEMPDCPAGALAFVLHSNKVIYFSRIPPD